MEVNDKDYTSAWENLTGKRMQRWQIINPSCSFFPARFDMLYWVYTYCLFKTFILHIFKIEFIHLIFKTEQLMMSYNQVPFHHIFENWTFTFYCQGNLTPLWLETKRRPWKVVCVHVCMHTMCALYTCPCAFPFEKYRVRETVYVNVCVSGRVMCANKWMYNGVWVHLYTWMCVGIVMCLSMHMYMHMYVYAGVYAHVYNMYTSFNIQIKVSPIHIMSEAELDKRAHV